MISSQSSGTSPRVARAVGGHLRTLAQPVSLTLGETGVPTIIRCGRRPSTSIVSTTTGSNNRSRGPVCADGRAIRRKSGWLPASTAIEARRRTSSVSRKHRLGTGAGGNRAGAPRRLDRGVLLSGRYNCYRPNRRHRLAIPIVAARELARLRRSARTGVATRTGNLIDCDGRMDARLPRQRRRSGRARGRSETLELRAASARPSAASRRPSTLFSSGVTRAHWRSPAARPNDRHCAVATR